MGIIGTVVAALSLLVVVPLLPVIAVLWVIDRIGGTDRGDRVFAQLDYREPEVVDTDERP